MIGSENSKKLIKIVGLGMGISIMMVMMVINNYTQLRDALILNEQKHLLTIVEITAQSVKNHFLTEERSLELLSKDLRFIENFKKLEENRPGYTKEELKYYYKASYPSIKNIQLLDKSGKLLSEYPEKRDEEHTKVNFSELPEVQKLIKEKSFQTSEVYFIDKKPYIYQLQPIMIDGNLKGIIRSQLSIEHIYNKYIKQIRSGEKGYASIKNGDGIFLMHPVDEQIGKDSVELRREINPNYEWKELEELFLDQKAKKNGTKIYHSTWTEDINPKVVKKFNAYASIELKDVFWIVTLSTDYDEVVSRIKKNYYMTILTSSMIVLSFTFIVIYIYITKERKRKLEVENSYLIQLKKLNKELEGDIEKRKRLEKKLLKTMEENKRKEAIMIHQSRHAAMGEMIGNIAHQWRQPLSSLSLLISNIEDIILYGEDDKKYIEDVFERSRFLLKRMSETIDDFSNFFKPKSNKETFDIKRLVDITQNICSERLKHNNIILTNSVDKDIRIIGYFNQLSQVMLNIVNNGIDAITSKGNSGKIHITATANQKKDIEIIIEDNGGGIPENLINNIFEPYFSTKDEKNGTGIGLHMSKIIVENNFSGKIRAYNGSEGAIFKIIIPGKEE